MTPTSYRTRGLAAAGLALFATACVAPSGGAKGVPLFFPPAPELPRIQYLTSFSGLKDVETQTAFNRFVVGEKQDVKLDKPYGVAYPRREDLRLRHQRHGRRLRPEAKGVRDPEGRGRSGEARPADQHQHRGRRHQVRRGSRPRSGRRVRPERRVPEGLRRRRGRGGPSMPWRSKTGSTSPTSATASSRSSTRQRGEPIKTIGDKGEPIERLDRPTNLAFDGEGDLYVTDVGRFQVVKFDRDGHFKAAVRQARRRPGALREAQGNRPRSEGPALRGRCVVQQRPDLQQGRAPPAVLRGGGREAGELPAAGEGRDRLRQPRVLPRLRRGRLPGGVPGPRDEPVRAPRR